MSISLKPSYYIEKLSSLTPQMLKDIGVELLLMDLDNTISPYGEPNPTAKVLAWTENMKRNGIKLYIVSNSKKIRPDVFAKAMDIPFVKYARKPSPKMVKFAAEEMGVSFNKTALVGDQIFTDVFAGNLAGVKSIVVEPIKFSNPFFKVRYLLEKPFRNMCKNNL